MSEESTKNLHSSAISFAPKLIGVYAVKKVEFKGICLKQDSVSFLQKFSKLTYFLRIRYIVKIFKHRFYTRQLLVWSCKVN